MQAYKAARALLAFALFHAAVQAQETAPASATDTPSLFNQAFAQRKKAAVQKIALPVFLDGRELGVIKTQIRADGVEVERLALAALLEPILQPQWLAPLSANPAASAWMDLAEVNAIGWTASYAAQRLAIDLDLPLPLRKTESLSLGARQLAVPLGALRPEPWSWIVNGRWVMTQQSTVDASAVAGRLYPDVAGRWQDWVFEGSGAYALSGPDAGAWSRASTRLVRDWPTDAIRLSVGDVNSSSHASATSLALGGLALSRAFSLNPALPVQSEPGTALSLQQGAAVDVRVNGMLARTLQLGPGVYQLSEIPVFTGANAVELTVVEPGGKTRVLVFDYFYDATLLKSGVNEFEVALGAPVLDAPTGRSYAAGQTLFSGWWRRGWTDALSAGVSLQLRDAPGLGAQVVGADAVWATALGNVSGWWGQSRHPGFEGHALSAQWRWNQQMRREDRQPLLARSLFFIAQASASTQGYAPISADQPSPALSDMGLRLGVLWADGYSGSLSASLRNSAASADRASSISVGLRRRIDRNWSLDGSISTYRQGDAQDTNLGVLLTYTGTANADRADPGMFWQSTATYQSKDQRKEWAADAAGNTTWLGSDTAWQVSGTHSDALSGQDTAARARAWMGRAEAIVAARQSSGGNGSSSLVEASLASALVVSKGGGWGWSAPIYDSAVQFKPYKGYEGLKLLVDARSETSALSSDRFGTPPLASLSAYVTRELQIDLEDLPPGMGLGEDRPVLLPGYRSVVVVPVGSRARTQATGRLLGANGQALPLHAIVLTGLDPAQTVDLFTNRKGLFLSPQLPPGVYALRQPGDATPLARFEVSDAQAGVVDIGAVQVPQDTP